MLIDHLLKHVRCTRLPIRECLRGGMTPACASSNITQSLNSQRACSGIRLLISKIDAFRSRTRTRASASGDVFRCRSRDQQFPTNRKREFFFTQALALGGVRRNKVSCPSELNAPLR